ncbi:CMP-N-acetylneuraminate-beta-galactosamide-alpha-2,3-sialyltransferase 1-like, partial [Neolamprologus brichardi]|uniref:CMP-N-acetylneuraminate-beta-galactosamide- alpha-2,3-sialyltransferase 1-like n=1 Tax=Neolamprologus brichardi TaxID=32507 RepID=UPI001643DAFF
MSKKHKPSEEDFNWWKPLQGEKQNFTVYNKTLERVFQTITPFADVEEPRPDRCRRCAVVGNSGNLRGSQYGPLIDFHDIVISARFTRPAGLLSFLDWDGFSALTAAAGCVSLAYCLRFASLHASWTSLCLMLSQRPAVLAVLECLVLEFTLVAHLSMDSARQPLSPGATCREKGAPNSNKIANKNLVSILHPAFMKYVHDVWLRKKAAYPSTGFLAVVLSLLMCDEVNVFGFGADSEGNWSHYFEILKNKRLKTGGHPGEEEYKMIVKLHMKKKI